MKIAILGSARSGSTSLYHLFEEIFVAKKYFCISEPFNAYWRIPNNLKLYDIDTFNSKSNVFIKTFVSELQRPQTFLNDEPSYWDWFFNYFDKVILLDRMDKDLQSESLTYHMKKKDFYSWQKKQHYDLSNIKEGEIEASKAILNKETEKKLLFAEKGYPMFYFEDLFIKKDKQKALELFNYLELDFRDDLYEKYIISDTYRIRLSEYETRFKSLI